MVLWFSINYSFFRVHSWNNKISAFCFPGKWIGSWYQIIFFWLLVYFSVSEKIIRLRSVSYWRWVTCIIIFVGEGIPWVMPALAPFSPHQSDGDASPVRWWCCYYVHFRYSCLYGNRRIFWSFKLWTGKLYSPSWDLRIKVLHCHVLKVLFSGGELCMSSLSVTHCGESTANR